MSGPQCSENPPNIVWSAFGKGSTVELGGLNTYVSGSSDSTLAILLISDVYDILTLTPELSPGGPAVKFVVFVVFTVQDQDVFRDWDVEKDLGVNKKLADKVASAGYYVVVPDFFYGDPFLANDAKRPLAEWFKSHGTDKGFEDAKPVIEALKSHGISAIGAAGFCWGGKVVAKLAKSDYIQAAVLLHPSMVTVDDIKEVKVAIAILGAEFDKISPPKLINQFEEVLYTKPEVDSFVKIYNGVSHGWTVRYKDEDEKEVKSAEEAHGDMIAWFNEQHLKAKKRILAKF